jgi:hypothetical protein
MRTERINIGLSMAAWMLAAPILSLAPRAAAGSPPQLSGGIFGQVKDGTGVVQMGATVLLYNRYDQLVRHALSNEQGKFVFDSLSPDLYSIRVTLASFVPAMRRNIAVAAGSENLLQINLATLLSSIDLVSAGPARGALMSDEWKWVLRSSQATRPVLRLLPVSSSATNTDSVFSDTTALVRVSAGDSDSFSNGGEQDLGTAFAVATSIYGSTRVQFSGNVGYTGASVIPSAGFRASYSRSHDGQSSPEIIVTARQLYLPNLTAVSTADPGLALRTVSLAIRDKADLTDHLRLEYGASMDTIMFVERLNYVSPFARATYDLGKGGSVRFAYSDGADPGPLLERSSSASLNDASGNEQLSQDLAALALLPRISQSDDRLRVERTRNFEGGYRIAAGSRVYGVAVYSEAVSNAAFVLSGPRSFVPFSDSLPDLDSNSRIFNVGDYNRMGYAGSMKQLLGARMDMTIAVGRAGALADDQPALSDTPASIRTSIQQVQRMWASAAFSATLPASGTRLTSSFGWTDVRVLMPDHLFLTEDVIESTGWNLRVRQPLPFFPSRSGRLEATAEMRNLLAQGYLPLEADGQKALLTNSPKAVRGGLTFIF